MAKPEPRKFHEKAVVYFNMTTADLIEVNKEDRTLRIMSLGGNRLDLVLCPETYQSMATKLRELAGIVETAFWAEGKKYKLDADKRQKEYDEAKKAVTAIKAPAKKKIVKKVVKKR